PPGRRIPWRRRWESTCPRRNRPRGVRRPLEVKGWWTTRTPWSRIWSRPILPWSANATLCPQTVADGVRSKLGVGAHPHFFEDARAIGADRFDAQRQFRRDFRHGLAAADHPSHLVLCVR